MRPSVKIWSNLVEHLGTAPAGQETDIAPRSSEEEIITIVEELGDLVSALRGR
ncbi:hypothetical protein ACL02O_13200 [Micromonospora sp. MS34]|uniref:hypothetical protein n=1 Tax=Micromonospora sp. MS34 TaxID=3385971 RepID=UPI0039A249D1